MSRDLTYTLALKLKKTIKPPRLNGGLPGEYVYPKMSTITTNEEAWVRYHDGGVPGRRQILIGAAAKTTFNKLPKIDVRRIYSDSVSDRQSVAKEVGEACRDVGFFYAVNHGVDEGLLDDTFGAMKRFFDLPKAVKMEVHNQKNPKFRGYVRLC